MRHPPNSIKNGSNKGYNILNGEESKYPSRIMHGRGSVQENSNNLV